MHLSDISVDNGRDLVNLFPHKFGSAYTALDLTSTKARFDYIHSLSLITSSEEVVSKD